MSKLDTTTQELFLGLGSTSQSRSARADAVFRRLRLEKSEQIFDALMRAPARIDAGKVAETDLQTEQQPKKKKASRR